MSSRPGLRPSCVAANDFSHSFNSWRSVARRVWVSVRTSILVIAMMRGEYFKLEEG